MPMLLATLLDSIPVTHLPFYMVSAMWTIGSISDGNLFLTKNFKIILITFYASVLSLCAKCIRPLDLSLML